MSDGGARHGKPDPRYVLRPAWRRVLRRVDGVGDRAGRALDRAGRALDQLREVEAYTQRTMKVTLPELRGGSAPRDRYEWPAPMPSGTYETFVISPDVPVTVTAQNARSVQLEAAPAQDVPAGAVVVVMAWAARPPEEPPPPPPDA